MSTQRLSVVAMFLAGAFIMPTLAAGAQQPDWALMNGLETAPVNPEFERYMGERAYTTEPQTTEDGHALGAIPPRMKLPATVAPTGAAMQPMAIPPKFDLRTSTPVGVTPVRDQRQCGSCWAFGGMGSLESYLKYKRAITADFSEADLNENHGFDFGTCLGGNWWMTTAYMARWGGPVTEAQVPYPYWVSAPTSYAAFLEEDATAPPAVEAAPGVPTAYYAQNIWLLSSTGHPLTATERAILKQAIMSNGGVNIHYYHNNLYYNSTNKSFYNTTNPGTNHSVTVVGWDDSFLRTRFNTAAPGNGAFILKNSWGTAWGDRGYFYMSYYDKSLHMGAQFYNAEPVTNYTRVYQYDPLGWVSSYGYTSGDKTLAWISNIFMASINATKIKAISLYTPVSNSTYTLYVRSNVTPDNPMSGTQVAIKTGTIPRAGYNTIPLTTIGTVAANKPFSVVVKLKTPSYNYPIPAEEAVEGFSTAASSAPGQSYFSQNGVSWGSAGAYFNVALKALAVR